VVFPQPLRPHTKMISPVKNEGRNFNDSQFFMRCCVSPSHCHTQKNVHKFTSSHVHTHTPALSSRSILLNTTFPFISRVRPVATRIAGLAEVATIVSNPFEDCVYPTSEIPRHSRSFSWLTSQIRALPYSCSSATAYVSRYFAHNTLRFF
jgi:hypothetical protein